VNLIEAFSRDQMRRGLSPATIDKRRRTLEPFAREPGLGATREQVEQFLDDRHLSAKSRAVYLSHFSAFYRWACEEGHLTEDPTTKIKPPKVGKRLPRPVSETELNELLDHATPRLRAMLLLGALAGLRCMEIAGLNWEHVLPEGAVRVIGKGNQERLIPLHVDLIEALQALSVATRGPVFCQRDGRSRMTPDGVSHELGALIHGVGIGGGGHRLRHAFATNLYQHTLDIVLVRDLMGHADIATTAIYAAADQSKAADAIAGLRKSA